MKRRLTLLTLAALFGCLGLEWVAAAQIVPHASPKPKSAQGHKVPLRHDQLTLYPHGRPKHRQPAYSYTRHRFDQPTPIHNTFMGAPRY